LNGSKADEACRQRAAIHQKISPFDELDHDRLPPVLLCSEPEGCHTMKKPVSDASA
jgi:hypothetical protein